MPANKKKIIFIVGPTAAGKTELSYQLAKELGLDNIVSCDSMLVYKEPRILTAKPESEILQEIKHYFVDIISVEQEYNVFQYYQQAVETIESILDKTKIVIVCGGSGLYMKSLLDGLFFDGQPDEKLRKQLELQAEKEGLAKLHMKLKQVDPQAADKISSNDKRRIIRALEVFMKTGKPISLLQKERNGLWGKYAISIFGLWRQRESLYNRINKRVDKMIELGAIEEAKNLASLNLSKTASKIIGIEELNNYLLNKCSLEQAIEKMKQKTRNFSKRQYTWFKHEKRLEWINMDDLSLSQVKERVKRDLV